MFSSHADRSDINLYKILADPSSLAYWLEYMDRRGRSRLVQLWLTIEGFKDPLEAGGQDSALDSIIQPSTGQISSGNDRTIGDDAGFLYEAYFSKPDMAVDIPSKHLAVIKEFATANNTPLSSLDSRRLKDAVFASQKAVFQQMEEDDWADFQKSELYRKAVTDLSRSTMRAPSSGHIKAPTTAPRPQIYRQCQRTAPAGPLHPPLEIRSPPPVPRPTRVNGNFTPAIGTPSASVSIAPPTFDRTVTEPKLGSRKTSDSDIDLSSSIGSLPTSPPQLPRRSSHLDFLISGEEPETPEERGRLFEAEDEAVIEEDEDDFVQIQRMEAIQAALNDIIASDSASSHRDAPFSPEIPSRLTSTSMVSARPDVKPEEYSNKRVSRSVEDLRGARSFNKASVSALQSRVPSTSVGVRKISHRASLPKLSPAEEDPGSKLFDDETHGNDGDNDSEGNDHPLHDVVQLAAPGDLQLPLHIARLQDKVLDLIKQEHLLDTLIRQAELTGNEKEIRILRRSQTSVRREQRTAIFQKAQFEQQKEENRIVPGRTIVSIPSSLVTTEDNHGGKHVVRYRVELKQVGEDGQTVTVWVVARRYNEFWELDRAIQERAQHDAYLLNELKKITQLPPKKLASNLSASFVESRRVGLERYLQVHRIAQADERADHFSR